MELARRFEGLRDKARQGLAGAAKSEPHEALAGILRVLQESERAIAQIAELGALANRLESDLDQTQVSPAARRSVAKPTVVASSKPRRNRPGKREGKAERGLFLQRVQRQGSALYPEGGRIYVAPGGKRVGIGFATEDRRGNLWWLGVPDESLDIAVLLCKSSAGERYSFVLPSEFLSKIRPFLSTNRSDLIFHVRQDGPNFELTDAPQSGLKAINQFRDRYDLLR